MNIKNRIPPQLYELLDGSNLAAKQQEAMMLLTVTEDGWPHVAMISVGEIVALSPDTLRLGLWSGTVTTGNILRSGKAMLCVFYAGTAMYSRLALSPLEALADAKHPRQRFEARVVSSRADTAQYADILGGVQIALHDPAAVIARWQETVADLHK
ncbi:pyridoxamine 5'-phosphate oxidase family protein [Paenibacillus sp. J22TS3]|uniref:pyridoxamine 5'-phosphate oxidase family protein n=1 Tax=Paenibacillus sp. J22TS3 TaxID=2807192 RepID=UPI001B21119D|nr:pyridoxamine 5'-phosphate oxidase family protein [Paenibacillus sp. J22TS3]GIP24205.1 hypothetical protein J22TS3_44800 [Paenibacillus sp. J22TS3]